MNSKLFIFFEYMYLAMALFAAYLTITNWETDRGTAYLFAGFTIVGIFMFFFRRRFRKQLQKRKEEQNR